ncbi:TorF family putative porin [Massilia sp. LXY-6]|uniref:TorF family putative porin n=1 Tax=Massilia sp. LXY-6 TaxID=3379823 RepID=UPI003EDF8CF2
MSHDRRRDRRSFALAAAGFSLACAAFPACAQLSGNLTLVSEYAVRGISLSAGRPALQLRIDHDLAGGWYAGGFASPATLGERRQGELIVYGGRAGRLASGLSWDAGISRTTFLRDRDYDYTEFHAGLALDRASVRLFLSPAYYGDEPTAYLDLNAFHPLDERLRLTFHAGLLHTFGAYAGPRDRADLRLGLASTFGDCTLQLGWQTLLHAEHGGPPRARALTGSAGIRF